MVGFGYWKYEENKSIKELEQKFPILKKDILFFLEGEESKKVFESGVNNYEEEVIPFYKGLLQKKNLSNIQRVKILNKIALLYDKINRIKEAEKMYLKALVLYRTLAKSNSSIYNVDVAITLNHLGTLYNKVNRIKEAEKMYLEALGLYRALAKSNPSAYNYYVAMTLNNLANLYNKVNRVKESEKMYLEALGLYRSLAKNNPSSYGIDLAKSLVTGVYLLNQPVKNLDEAESVLKEFKGIPKADWLLGIIQKLRQTKN